VQSLIITNQRKQSTGFGDLVRLIVKTSAVGGCSVTATRRVTHDRSWPDRTM